MTRHRRTLVVALAIADACEARIEQRITQAFEDAGLQALDGEVELATPLKDACEPLTARELLLSRAVAEDAEGGINVGLGVVVSTCVCLAAHP